MVNKCIIPSVISFENQLLDVITKKAAIGVNYDVEKAYVEKISALVKGVSDDVVKMETALKEARLHTCAYEQAVHMKNNSLAVLSKMRNKVDDLERIVSKKCWPYPSYRDLLYSVKY